MTTDLSNLGVPMNRDTLPLISICLPVLNLAYGNCEQLLMDDGSNGRTPKVAQRVFLFRGPTRAISRAGFECSVSLGSCIQAAVRHMFCKPSALQCW
jgi:hypothetical protein